MSNDSDWYPARRDERRVLHQNFLEKIDDHVPAMAAFLTAAQVARFKLMCVMYITVYDWLAQCEARLSAAYSFQRDLEKGTTGEPVNLPPAFEPLDLPPEVFKGYIDDFRKEVGLLKKQPGYTQAIGLDLMIVREKGDSIAPDQKQPAFRYEVRQGYRLLVTGSMQGMRAANFYYRRKGATEWVFVGYLTRTPGEIHIAPAQAGVPEIGEIKAIFSDNNVEVGLFSDSKEVTLS